VGRDQPIAVGMTVVAERVEAKKVEVDAPTKVGNHAIDLDPITRKPRLLLLPRHIDLLILPLTKM
jgi:hypothetical protein